MGYFNHHTIVVTAWGRLEKVRDKALIIFPKSQVSEILTTINEQESFFIAPDGSKEGWEESDQGNDNRLLFTNYLDQNNIDYIEVFFGGDEPDHNGILNTTKEWDGEE